MSGTTDQHAGRLRGPVHGLRRGARQTWNDSHYPTTALGSGRNRQTFTTMNFVTDGVAILRRHKGIATFLVPRRIQQSRSGRLGSGLLPEQRTDLTAATTCAERFEGTMKSRTRRTLAVVTAIVALTLGGAEPH